MSQNRPHPRAAFEGYYSKFSLPSGACIALVICSVHHASQFKKPHMVSITHYPAHGADIWQQEFWDKNVLMRAIPGRKGAFELKIPGVGSVQYDSDGRTNYDLDFNDFTFRAKTRNACPWGISHDLRKETSPEGWLSYLPLPLHWHVSSLESDCTYALQMQSPLLPTIDSFGSAKVHQEKNWGNSFPKGHIWIQARDEGRGLCLAGGEILGFRAYLVGYRSRDLNIDFGPPFSLQVFGFSPFFKISIDWERREVSLDVQSFTKRLLVSAKAPTDSFFTLGAPFPEGHREQALAQSFRATLNVTILQRGSIFGRWKEIRSDVIKGASLEFGGSYYGAKKSF